MSDDTTATGERFSAEEADNALLATPQSFQIADRTFEIRGLNLSQIKQMGESFEKILKPFVDGMREYGKAQQKYLRELPDNPESVPPDALWWYALVIEHIDDVVNLVYIVLKRSDGTITAGWLEENFEPFVHLQKLLPMVRDTNMLGVLAKKVAASRILENLKTASNFGRRSPVDSDSPTSPSTSPTTTESTSPASSGTEASSPLDSFSFSTIGSPDTSNSSTPS